MTQQLKFDTLRYCRANAGRMGQWCGQDVAGLIAGEVDALKAELAALKDAAVHIYNSGYHAGHHCTVEGGYVDIHSSDMDTYHAEEVAELLAALVGEE